MTTVVLPPEPPKGRKRTEIERRVDATNATKEKFEGRAFSFRRQSDCMRLIQFHLRSVGRPIAMAAAGTWTNVEGARAAMARVGVRDIPELLDRQFERIPFAEVMVGDVIQLEAEEGVLQEVGAMAVYLGHNAAFAYHEDAKGPVAVLLLEPPLAVWKAL